MLELVFGQTAGTDSRSFGPYPAFRVEGAVIRETRAAKELARHAEHHWETAAGKFFRLDCAGPLTITFEDESGTPVKTLGPYEHFSAADGIAFADRLHFASYAESTGLWYCKQAGGSWPVMIIRPAPT